ncbi:MAG TPA: TrmH family RNA methyltransferase [Termitinemataceae bacterium]|mgnify:CR=1 FL=1|nr:TrmH family RNA methyltransferase [Treponemataceae bacterium]HOJ97948.1 TrmH family RNA methyltransferase [Termitinemataceae bacterium]HOM22195.1 TrmH family RNA methyltransferase [Termitinemataceae bacterium]HPP99383.1 TrmH family RNA methyltransferase [Termitinemataceae bacterium]
MIPLSKLARLPLHQQLRKIEKQCAFWEAHPDHMYSHISYLEEMLALLLNPSVSSDSQEKRFSSREEEGIRSVYQYLKGIKNLSRAEIDRNTLIRNVNQLRHILLQVLGVSVADWDFMDPEGNIDVSKRRVFLGVHLYLDDVRSPFNIGSIFRTAESFGVEKIWLSPFCADPRHPRAVRSAMGCIEIVPWERLDSLEKKRNFFDECLRDRVSLFALETGGTDLALFPFPQKGIMIIGSEELGVSPELLALADHSLGRVSIPTFGAKGSLNVAVATGITLQSWASFLISDSGFPV